MAKKGAAVAIGLAVLIGGGAYLYATGAEAKDRDDDDDDLDDLDDKRPDIGDDFDRPGRGDIPGKGPGGAPKPADGGKTWGDAPPGASYTVPEDWDPMRGLWISLDCEVVVEAPGWYCGTFSDDTPVPFGDPDCVIVERESYAETMAQDRNGVTGYIFFLIYAAGVDESGSPLPGLQPEEIAYQILTEISPMCADLPDDMWPDGLWDWYEYFLERVILTWEYAVGESDEWEIPFEPEAQGAA